jgi:hypothetical protein
MYVHFPVVSPVKPIATNCLFHVTTLTLATDLNYAAQFLGNTGNYKSFGDSKFVPRLEPRRLKQLATVSPAALKLHELFKVRIFAGDDEAKLLLGYPDAGVRYTCTWSTLLANT